MLGPQQWGLFFYRGLCSACDRLGDADLGSVLMAMCADLERGTGFGFSYGASPLKWWKNQNMYDGPVCFRYA